MKNEKDKNVTYLLNSTAFKRQGDATLIILRPNEGYITRRHAQIVEEFRKIVKVEKNTGIEFRSGR